MAVAASTALLLAACGGGGGGEVKSGSNAGNNQTGGTTPTGNTGTKPTGNTGTTPTAGFVSVTNNDNLFPNCLVSVGSSEDPAYLSCMSATYKGKNPAGEACQVAFNGKTRNIKYSLGNDHYNLYGTNFIRSLYSRINNNGKFALQTAAVYFGDKTVNKVSSYESDVTFTFGAGSHNIDLSYNSEAVTDKKISCIISEYKLAS